MLSTFLLSLLAALSFLGVHAHSSAASSAAALPTSISQVPPCVLNCTTTAATQAGCSGITDLTCVCTSSKFQTAALSCLQASCSASDQASATGLQSTLCASVNASAGSGSASAAASATSPASASATQSSAASGPGSASAVASPTSPASASATHSSAASGLTISFGTGPIIGFVTVLAGIITGTLL
ncbi:hypothetical protein JB92DRAFT_3101636 [Gautieria morchelliformis]|nr:hypothetical protein JB92DRAFT_3101636 [Gautieria morchelliformis]